MSPQVTVVVVIFPRVIASLQAKRSHGSKYRSATPPTPSGDCFVASFLAMTRNALTSPKLPKGGVGKVDCRTAARR
jgi:hypothetical protein